MVLLQDFNPGAICNFFFFTLKYPICFYVDVYILIPTDAGSSCARLKSSNLIARGSQYEK